MLVTLAQNGGFVGIGTASPTTTLEVAGSIKSTAGFFYPATSATLAAAGTTQGTATAIINQISIVTSGTGGVILPAGLPVGTKVEIGNANFSAINVYPNSGASIGTMAANAAISIPSGAYLTFMCGSSTYWFPAGAVYS